MARCDVRSRRSSQMRSIQLAVTLAIGCLWAPFAAAQTPSGDYGAVPIGGSVEGVLTALAEQGGVVYHTYTATIPGPGPVTVRVEGFGSDLDLALKFGAPIVDYRDVDHLDTSDDGNPTFTFQAPAAGVLYIDVLNLLPAAARYRLTVTAPTASAPAAPPAAPAFPAAPPAAPAFPSAPPAALPLPSAPPPAPPASPAANPLAPALAPANPLAPPADPWVGAFEGDGLRITIAAEGGGYAGELALGDQRFPFRAAAAQPGRLEGSFESGAAAFAFTADLADDAVTLATGGATYVMRRITAPPPPANPLGGGAAPTVPQGLAAGTGATLVTGPHGSLTQDGAEAFVDALLFAVQQLGLPGTLTPAERAEAIRELANGFPTLPASHQAALTQARDTWNLVQAGWATATQPDREQFVLGVLVIAFGEELVQQALAASSNSGGGAGGGGGGGCQTIDDCIGRYAPGGGIDFNRTASCGMNWSCDRYDASTGTFHYRDGR
jgi:hypothetical protein